MRNRSTRFSLLLVVAATFLSPAWSFSQKGLSHVRVVRLSYVSGKVAVKRPVSTEWTKGVVNTPIQEGFELETSTDSYAEVEFENGSSARLGQLTGVGFGQLALDADGNKLNRLEVKQGYATFHFMPEHHDVYSVTVAGVTLNPSGKSKFRTDFTGGQVRVEGLSGSLQVAAGSESRRLGKEEVVQFTPGNAEMAFNVQHGITKDAWDKWSEERDRQAQLAMRDQAVPAPGGVAYGWSDLDFYGEWAMIPGFGYGWAPYAAAGWSPFTMGMWDNYPGFGLTWISSEPWGWLPYHYGMWNFDSTFGWFWMPGNFGYWSPALVSWYSGPGWLGWAPAGAFMPRTPNAVTTVAGGVVRTGQMLTLNNVQRQPVTAGAVLKGQPAFEAGARETLSESRLAGNAALSLRNPSGSLQSRATPAPATVLMGGDPAAERALLEKRPGALGRAFGVSRTEPLRVRGGSTLGGTYAVRGSAGEFRGDVFHGAAGGPGARGMSGPAVAGRSHSFNHPTVLAHGQSSASSGGMGGMHSSGVSRGASASSSVSVSPSVSSSGHSASSGGGHH